MMIREHTRAGLGAPTAPNHALRTHVLIAPKIDVWPLARSTCVHVEETVHSHVHRFQRPRWPEGRSVSQLFAQSATVCLQELRAPTCHGVIRIGGLLDIVPSTGPCSFVAASYLLSQELFCRSRTATTPAACATSADLLQPFLAKHTDDIDHGACSRPSESFGEPSLAREQHKCGCCTSAYRSAGLHRRGRHCRAPREAIRRS